MLLLISSCYQELFVPYNPWKNDGCYCSFKKSLNMKEGMVSQYGYSSWNGHYSSLQIHWQATLKNVEWCFAKKYFPYKHLMLQLDSFNSSLSQNLQYLEKKLSLNKVLWKRSSLEEIAVPEVTLTIENVWNCSSKKFDILD